MKLPNGQREHEAGDSHCAVCEVGWPQQHSEVADHCCPGFIHAETCQTDDPTEKSKVIYYCDMCYEDDPL